MKKYTNTRKIGGRERTPKKGEMQKTGTVKKRRRSSKKLPAIQSNIDYSVLDIDWTKVATLIKATIIRPDPDEQQQQCNNNNRNTASSKKKQYNKRSK